MTQITEPPATGPVCVSGQVIGHRDPDGGYPVDILLPVAACPQCGWSARLVAPEDLADPLDILAGSPSTAPNTAPGPSPRRETEECSVHTTTPNQPSRRRDHGSGE